MAGNSFGTLLTLTTFGESHGIAIGGILDGFPAGIAIDEDFITGEMERRRGGKNRFSTSRSEEDRPEILSGVFEGKSTGAPICFVIRNKEQKSRDYSDIKDVFRPSHADYTYFMKYGNVDYRGGGRSSGRETACRVAAGALVKLFLREKGIEIHAGIRSIGMVSDPSDEFSYPFGNDFGAVNSAMVPLFEKQIDDARAANDSVGGIVECRIYGVPAGLGDPCFDKLNAALARAVMSIGACKGFEIGDGFRAAQMRGSSFNDEMHVQDGRAAFRTNHSGGILGGISSGETIIFSAAFKPTPSISRIQNTVDRQMNERKIEIHGRHDPCIVPRAVVVVEAMAALTIADYYLREKAYA